MMMMSDNDEMDFAYTCIFLGESRCLHIETASSTVRANCSVPSKLRCKPSLLGNALLGPIRLNIIYVL